MIWFSHIQNHYFSPIKSNQDDTSLGRKAQGQHNGSLLLDLIWVKLVLTFSSLFYCFSSPMKGE